LSRHRDKIYSIIAHDIRSPFVNIKMIIDLIASGKFNINNTDFNGIIASLGKKADATFTLLNNLLEWTKNQSGAIAVSPKTLKIYPLLEECIQLLKANADSKNISLILDAPEYIEAFFDEITMHTVFRNLISNAIKFTPENGIIQLHAKIYDHNLQILVKDNGMG
jgi:two-component system, sensor histidine kinase and response regulator